MNDRPRRFLGKDRAGYQCDHVPVVDDRLRSAKLICRSSAIVGSTWAVSGVRSCGISGCALAKRPSEPQCEKLVDRDFGQSRWRSVRVRRLGAQTSGCSTLAGATPAA
jgi:hypothetical protein